MRLLSILPIARAIRKETLTYFSSEDIPVGAIVAIPLRKKTVTGIITESRDATEAKAEIKGMNFSVKKIIRHKGDAELSPTLLEAMRQIANDSVSSLGAVIAGLVPKICLEHPELFFKEKIPFTRDKSFETLAIQSSDSERIDAYKSIIRESFAKKKSIALITPTAECARKIAEILSKGIAEFTLVLADTDSKKSLVTWHKKAYDKAHPKLLIGTLPMLSLLPLTIGTLIVEEESSSFHKMRRAPYIDTRHAARALAKALGIRIIFGDKLLSVETLAKIKEGKTSEYSRISKRNPYKIQTLLVDMKPSRTAESVQSGGPKEERFKVLSPDLIEMVRYSVKSGKKLFIYSTRRGLSSQTVCRDCGTTVLCDDCESPVVLHGKDKARTFVCHHCGKSRSAFEKCKRCDSWNLVPYGIGIERVEEELEKITDAEIIRVDSDTVKTDKDLKTKMERFLGMHTKSDKNRSILLGTDLALRALPDENVDFSAIISIESLRSLPDFRTSERVMHAILDVKSKATECMLLQSREPDDKIIELGLSGDLEGFARDEIRARKHFGYPPYMRLVKLTIQGQKDRVKIDAAEVVKKLEDYEPRVFPAFIKSIRGETLLHILLKVTDSEWPNKELSEILLSLPPSVKIDTSPQSLL